MDSFNYYGELLLANQVREEGLDWRPRKYGIKVDMSWTCL
jgi:hypothetical protein